MLVCDGSQWKAVYEWDTNSSRALFQVDNDTGSCTTDKTGRLRYNDGTDTWEYCTGSAWSPFESAAGGGGSCTSYTGTVNSFSVPVAYRLSGETYTWPEQTVSGLTEDLAHACVTGNGSPSILVDSTDRAQGPFPVVDTTDIQVSAITPSTNTLTIGTNFSTVFEVREATCTTYTGAVDSFTYPQIFTDFSQVVTSESRQITGLSNDYAYACVSGEGNPSIVLDGVDKGAGPIHIPENSQVQIKATTANTATTRTATLNVGQNFSTDFKFTAGCAGSGSQAFNFVGSVQTLDITADMSFCTFDITIKGAGGNNTDGEGGTGGATQFQWRPEESGTVYILVGEAGVARDSDTGSFGGGGESRYEGGAGGASGIRFVDDATLNNTVLAVAGGGGVGWLDAPGNGAGLNDCNTDDPQAPGTGGCNNVGGQDGGGSNGADGAKLEPYSTAGIGHPDFLISGGAGLERAAGGGGYGGGGGDPYTTYEAGGGGGGYINTSAVESGASLATPTPAGQHGIVEISWGP